MTLDIHSGALVSLAQALANAGLLTGDPKEASKTYEDRINELVNTSKNNQLVVEPGAVTEPKSEKELKRDIARARKIQEKLAKEGKIKKEDKENSSKENRVDTNYVIDNVIHVIIDVDKL